MSTDRQDASAEDRVGDGLPTAVVCDDHQLIRDSLAQILDGVVTLVGEAATGKEALQVLERLQPDVALLDVGMPPPDGLEVAGIVRSRWPDMRIALITMHTEDAILRRATEVGVDGYITKDSPADELRRAVRTVASGGAWVATDIGRRLMALTTRSGDMLTGREQEVLEGLAAGLRISDIADRLYLSDKTVKNHLTGVYDKLGAETGAQAVAIAYMTGLVSPHAGGDWG